MQVLYSNGIMIKSGDKKIALDPEWGFRKKVEFAIYSHAHSDHILGLKNFTGKAFTTEETGKVASQRYFQGLMPDINFLNYKHTMDIDGIKLTLHNSGHVLGSAQSTIEIDGIKVTFTGDLKTRKGLTTKKPDIVKSDVLIIESTYGDPRYVFPRKVNEEIIEWVEDSAEKGFGVMLGGYVFGKSQELTKLLNEHGIIPLAHPKICEINRVYEESGIELKYIDSGSREGLEMIKSGNFVLISPASMIRTNILSGIMNISNVAHIATGVATGWAVDPCVKYRYGVERVFPLSDHADFDELLGFVEKVDPERVYTYHGFSKRLAREIKERLGISADSVERKQRTLLDFFRR